MATSAEEWLKTFVTAESTLKDALSSLDREPTFVEVEGYLDQFQRAFENIAFASLERAKSHNVETRLWDMIGKVNTRYRKQFSKFRDEGGKKRPVEKRKLESRYIKFIKSNMLFYRGYIQRLSSQYRGIPELAYVANRLKLEVKSIDVPVPVSVEERMQIINSCHATLVRIGDLSRYRETETKSKERNWGPAKGYYNLAKEINPSSGLPFNQLAVIALADGNHFRALYHLYRAQALQNPHPSARANLGVEFKKIIQLRSKNELFPRGGLDIQERTVTSWFVYLHARCSQGEEWTEHEEAENELLSQLSVLLKERSLENQLQRLTLINIAAEYIARERAEKDGTNGSFLSTFQFYEKLNLKTFFTLLQILLPELAQEEEASGPKEEDLGQNLTAIARRILPSLRNYSSWLVSNASYLVAQSKNPLLGVQIKEFWNIYASALTLLAATFPAGDLPTINYLLEEDEDAIGFIPLMNDYTVGRFCGPNGELKPRHGQVVKKELPNIEMLYRIRQLLADGMELIMRDDQPIPVELVEDARFVYQEEGLPKEVHSPPQVASSHTHTRSTASINREDIERARVARNGNRAPVEDEQSMAAASNSNATTMNNMVTELVGSDATDHSPIRPLLGFPPQDTGNQFPAGTITACDMVKSMQRQNTPKMEREETLRPLASSIWTPMPGEANGSPQMRPGTAHRHFEPAGAVTPQLPQAPTSSFFQEDLARQQQQIQVRATNLNTPATPSSWVSQQENTAIPQNRPGSGGSPWGQPSSSTIAFPSPFSGGWLSDVPRKPPAKAQFGAIGQTPPSGQGG